MSRLLIATVVVMVIVLAQHGSCWSRRRKRRAPAPCPVRSCKVSYWSSWTHCSQVCGNGGVKSRTRTKTVQESCGGSCYYDLSQKTSCNRYCQNGGTPAYAYCYCRKEFTGKCCEHDATPQGGSGTSDKTPKGGSGTSEKPKQDKDKDKPKQDKDKGLSTGELLGIVSGIIISTVLGADGIKIIINKYYHPRQNGESNDPPNSSEPEPAGGSHSNSNSNTITSPAATDNELNDPRRNIPNVTVVNVQPPPAVAYIVPVDPENLGVVNRVAFHPHF